jgi:glutamate--cysteine ligase
MVTPPCDSASAAVEYLSGLHQYIVDRLPSGEHIWNTSMPCILHGGDSVRIGQYGSSFSGQMKHVYRRGLALRYGRRMQAIAGIHFNCSLPDAAWLVHANALASSADNLTSVSLEDHWNSLSYEEQMKFRTNGYFATMQNQLRVGWLVPYLFGASPAICKSYLAKNEGEELAVWNDTTHYAPYGTSLRMGKIGYRYSEDQPIDLSVRHTSVDAYIDDIIAHVSTEHPPYNKMGLHDANGFQTKGNYRYLHCASEVFAIWSCGR